MATVARPNSSSPMHARYSQAEKASADSPSPPTIRPGGSPSKEDCESCGTCNYSNYSSTSHVFSFISAGVVADTQLPDIVHTADRSTCQQSTHHYSQVTCLFAGSGRVEGRKQNTNREDKGDSCERHAVHNLDMTISISEDDGTVSNEMHAPDSNASHRNCRREQQIPRRILVSSGIR
jgi:hypothetical protein